jgi:hypothetical protein
MLSEALKRSDLGRKRCAALEAEASVSRVKCQILFAASEKLRFFQLSFSRIGLLERTTPLKD